MMMNWIPILAGVIAEMTTPPVTLAAGRGERSELTT